MTFECLDVKVNLFQNGRHYLTSPFGIRTIFGEKRMHNGVDLVSVTENGMYTCSDFVVAFADGEVVAAVNDVDGASPAEGNNVVIRCAGGEQLYYYHLLKGSVRVQKGDKVTAGQVIGYMGKTGQVTGPHLHFGIYNGRNWVDPMPYITGEKSLIAPAKPDPELTPTQPTKKRVTVSLPMLCWGSFGPEVYTLQILLKRKFAINVDVDGIYGAGTYQAVTTFQRQNDLDVDGYVGTGTWTKLLC